MTVAAMRDTRHLRALGIEPLRLRACGAVVDGGEAEPVGMPEPGAAETAPLRILRLALQPDPAQLDDPAISRMYQALTNAVPKAGLQSVRVCDVAGDPAAAVMVFGAAPPPQGVPAVRVLRADPLDVLHADRERKRLLWERLQALGRNGSG